MISAVDNNGQKWTTMDNNGQQWTTMDNKRQQWTTMYNNEASCPWTTGCHIFSENYDQQLSDFDFKAYFSKVYFCEVYSAYASSMLCEFIPNV